MRYLITGGAGFIGVNAAAHYAQQGHSVTVFDNLSRKGTKDNLEWLRREHPAVRAVTADVRTDLKILASEAAQCDVLLHLAAQVAVTTSVTDPRTDFEINALGAFNVLEAARQAAEPPIVLYSSTNKVYGGMEDVAVVEDANRYRYATLPHGASEERVLDFHSPYGCSKGAADQYVRDYARIYGMRTVVLRQSCIYGPHQFGIEDQGWIAWFTLRGLLGQPVTVYGDGKQVRDVLYVDDLVAAFDAAIQRIDRVSGRVYNIGGGPAYTLSLLELIGLIEKMSGEKLKHSFGDWRPGDQRVYISDIRRAHAELGWEPKMRPEPGIARMRNWMAANRDTILRVYQP
ncbi:MAG: NAD-dependent epimerase/dehydratase family protein [Acidipila sp.]|nr:NAD-dependent epimerase/dehydratase family protein [Acidipila sp.]